MNVLSFKCALKVLLLWAGLLFFSLPVSGQQAVAGAQTPICDAPLNGDEANEIVGRAAYKFLGDTIKQKGPDYWQPIDGRERALCLVEAFLVDGQEVAIYQAGFLKGIQTELYRVDVAGSEVRAFHVLYSPALDFMSGAHLAFTLVEMSAGADKDMLKLYAMYHSQPPYAQVRALIEAIISSAAEPKLTAIWQDQVGEPLIMIAGFK